MKETQRIAKMPTIQRQGELVPLRLLEDKVLFDSQISKGHPRIETREGFEIVDAVIEDAFFGRRPATIHTGEGHLGLYISVKYAPHPHLRKDNLLYTDREDIAGVMHLLQAHRTELLKDKKVIVYADSFFKIAMGLAVEDNWVL